MSRGFKSDSRLLWMGVVFGLGFHVLALLNSDAGLDVHVRLNLVQNNEGEWLLPWGGLRHTTGESIDAAPSIYDGWMLAWASTPTTMKLTSLGATFALALWAGARPAGGHEGPLLNPAWMMVVAFSPVLMFSTGRGYDEALLSLIVVGGLWWAWALDPERVKHRIVAHASLGTSLAIVVLWKGLGGAAASFVFVAVLLASTLWDRWWISTGGVWRNRPVKPMGVLLVGFALSLCLVSIFGAFMGPGSFVIISQHPFEYLLALLCATIIGPVMYFLVGCLLWPAINIEMNEADRGWTTAYLGVVSGVLLGAVVAYTAVLWTYESNLWGAGLGSTILLLGNNGRYTTIVLPVVLLMLKRMERSSSKTIHRSWSRQTLALALVLPFVLASSMVGHQLWSVEAGAALDEHLGPGDDFLFVGESSLAMHHLYAMRSHLNAETVDDVGGVWSSLEAFEPVLLENTTYAAVVIGPNVDMTLNESQWTLAGQDDVPLSVAGIQTGYWRLYLPA